MRRYSCTRRSPLLLALLAAGTALLAPTAGASARAGSPAWPSADWKRYVRAPRSVVVRPVRVVRVTGQVSNPQALVGGRGVTTLTFKAGAPVPSVVLDYGGETSGFPWFSGAPGGSGALVSSYSEQLVNLSPSGDTGGATPRAEAVVVRDGMQQGHVLQGGQRYQLLTLRHPGSVRLTGVGFRFTPFRGTPDTFRGWFLSSSSALNRIWYAGVYTLNLNELPAGTPPVRMASPVILDGAKRDRLLWAADLLPEIGALFVSHASRSYVDGSLRAVAAHGCEAPVFSAPCAGSAVAGPMPGMCAGDASRPCVFYSMTYSMALPLAVAGYYRYTGGLPLLRELWPRVRGEVDWQLSRVGTDGLISTTAPTFFSGDGADWNLDGHTGEYTYVNVLHVASLRAAAELSDAMGEHGLARSYRSAALRTWRVIDRSLWDERMGAYDAGTSARGFVAQDANAAAVATGLVDDRRAARVVATLAHRLTTRFGMLDVSADHPSDYTPVISPYIGATAVEASFLAGRDDLAYRLVRSEWGHMLDHDPGGVMWERIHPDGSLASGDSAAHGWATGVVPALTEFALGVRPLSAGYARYLVEPHVGDLAWVQGRMPTPRGAITVRWMRGHGRLDLEVDAPASLAGAVSVPLLGRQRVIEMDGRVVWDGRAHGVPASSDRGFVRFTGVQGHHVWSWR